MSKKDMVTLADREGRLALRRERRGSVEAWNKARQDALDELNDAIAQWATYRDISGEGPNQSPEIYFITFKRTSYTRLGLDQNLKPEHLEDIEQAGLMPNSAICVKTDSNKEARCS